MFRAGNLVLKSFLLRVRSGPAQHAPRIRSVWPTRSNSRSSASRCRTACAYSGTPLPARLGNEANVRGMKVRGIQLTAWCPFRLTHIPLTTRPASLPLLIAQAQNS